MLKHKHFEAELPANMILVGANIKNNTKKRERI